jgi:hypothetical protein
MLIASLQCCREVFSSRNGKKLMKSHTRSDARVGCETLLVLFLTSTSRKLTLQPNRFSEEQFPSARKCSTPRGERLFSWIEPKVARIRTSHSCLNERSTR